LALIGNVLDVARIEAGRLELRRERLDIRLLVDECVEACQALVRDKPIKIETDVPLDLPGVNALLSCVRRSSIIAINFMCSTRKRSLPRHLIHSKMNW
jgi:signal transduction histidine kinase